MNQTKRGYMMFISGIPIALYKNEPSESQIKEAEESLGLDIDIVEDTYYNVDVKII